MIDCLIIGGGPAGMTAAVYLARFRRSVMIVDGGQSRAARIPRSHNIPGVAEGVGGLDLLARHREQATLYDVAPVRGTVDMLDRRGGGFAASVVRGSGATHRVEARTILVATGVVDRDPALPDVTQAILDGFVRHCPVCDAFEVIGQNVGVLGRGRSAVGEAVFLRTYSDRVTLLMLPGGDALAEEDRETLRAQGIVLVDSPISAVAVEEDRIAALSFGKDPVLRFDTLYSALGADARTSLTKRLGARHDGPCDAVVVDDHQRTTVSGVWAAGDVVSSLNQVAVAWGQAAIAATDIHNQLRQGTVGA